MEVIGVKQSDFTTKDKEKKEIHGFNIYLSEAIADKYGTGVQTERIYLSDAKMEKMGYYPKIGDQVRVLYNKYGKVESVELCQ